MSGLNCVGVKFFLLWMFKININLNFNVDSKKIREEIYTQNLPYNSYLHSFFSYLRVFHNNLIYYNFAKVYFCPTDIYFKFFNHK